MDDQNMTPADDAQNTDAAVEETTETTEGGADEAAVEEPTEGGADEAATEEHTEGV